MATLSLTDTLQPVELADGVEIHLRVAGPAPRSIAWLIDFLIFCGILFGLSFVSGALSSVLGSQITNGIILISLFLLWWFYNVFFEMTKHAATPGQRQMGLKVCSVSGAPVRLSQSLIRNLLRIIDMMPAFYLFGITCCLFTRRFQRLGDLVADTVVVYADIKTRPQQTAEVTADPIVPPVVLTRVEQAAISDFLERASRWSDARRIEMTDILEPMTQQRGLPGLIRTCGIGTWIQKGGASSKP